MTKCSDAEMAQRAPTNEAVLHTTFFFDIIAETMLSGRGGIDVDKVEKGATDYSDSISWVILLTLLRAPRWMPYPGRGRVERARDYLREEVERMVAERRRSDQGPPDLVTRLLAVTDPEMGRSMSDRDVVDTLWTFLVAGHETTALALTWTFYLLSLHRKSRSASSRRLRRSRKGARFARRTSMPCRTRARWCKRRCASTHLLP